MTRTFWTTRDDDRIRGATPGPALVSDGPLYNVLSLEELRALGGARRYEHALLLLGLAVRVQNLRVSVANDVLEADVVSLGTVERAVLHVVRGRLAAQCSCENDTSRRGGCDHTLLLGLCALGWLVAS